MKTWTFVTAVFWLFFHLCLCPQSEAQGSACGDARGLLGTDVDTLLQRWYSLEYIRPPPEGT